MKRLLLILLLPGAVAWAQPFQTVLIAPNSDHYQAGIHISGGGLAAGHTNSFPIAGNGNRVLLSLYNGSGSYVWNRVYPVLPGAVASYISVDVKPVAAGGGFPAGYYVVGQFRKQLSPDQPALQGIFVTRLNAAGVILWHRELTPPGGQQATLEAVSCEVMNDRGVVMVANVQANFSQNILAARFTPAGAQMWTYRYNNPGCQGELNNIRAYESAKDVTGAPPATTLFCNGPALNSPPTAEAIVITGDLRPCTGYLNNTYGPNRRTFVLKINERGLEIWRFLYPSYADPSTFDSGRDLVQLPNRNFLVAGEAVRTDATGLNLTGVYAFEITPAGALVCGSVHYNSQQLPAYARAVTLSHKAGSVVVAGPIDSLNNIRRIFTMELQPACGNFSWAKLYPRAFPAIRAEGIDRSAANLGTYFVTADALLSGPQAFAMKTDAGGNVPGCPVVDLKFDRKDATVLEKLELCQQSFGDWVVVNYKSITVTPERSTCVKLGGGGPDPTGTEDEIVEATVPDDRSIGVSAYPNPVAQSVQIDFRKPHDSGIVEVFDLMGNSVLKAPVQKADREVMLNTRSLRSGIYTISIRLQDGTRRTIRIVKE